MKSVVARTTLAFALAALTGCASKTGSPPSESRHPVTLVAPGARACDVVLDVGDAPRTHAVFPESVRGSYSQRGARLAVSLVSRSDVPLGASPVSIVVPTALATPKVLSSTCYNSLGAALPSTESRID